jgi:Kef-type K+ transport system membrane component KefB
VTATSIAITANVFAELGKLPTPAAKAGANILQNYNVLGVMLYEVIHSLKNQR